MQVALDPVTIGRHPDCEVSFDAHRDIDASSRHAELRPQGEGWILVDVGSSNGTYVDGHKVTAATAHAMRDGATLRFGDVTAKFLSPISFVADLKRRLS